MKMLKIKRYIRVFALVLACVFIMPFYSACKIEDLEGAHVFMFKATGSAYGDLMYRGFSEYMEEHGEKVVFKSPSEATVVAQIEMLDTLIIQKVKSITISSCGITGYDQVFKKAREAGIRVISSDCPVAPNNRITHVDSCSTEAIGSSLIQTATLIALEIRYPLDGDLEKATREALEIYSGKELKFGVLSAAVDTASQNEWIDKMRLELTKDMYKGKVNPELEVQYGNDEIVTSAEKTNAFVNNDNVDVIISPTTIGIKAAGQVLLTSGSRIKLTGLGLPSEMQAYMPKCESDNEFDYPCPYMLLWDVISLGRVSAAVTLSTCNGEYNGQLGETITYNGKAYSTIEADDGGTKIISLDPYVFYKGNIKDWKDLL